MRHGASSNPPNRFERLHYDFADAEPDPDGEPPDPKVQYLRDPARSIVATNQSPDVGFDASVNPYRGCEHACAYCLSPATLVWHADLGWRPIGDVRTGDQLVGFDEFPRPGQPRKLRVATVEAVRWSRRPTLRLLTEGGEVVTTHDHLWITHTTRWRSTQALKPGQSLRRVGVNAPEPIDDDYRAGYIVGLTLGDSTFRYEPGWRSDKLGLPAAYWRVALKDREPLDRLVAYLRRFGVEAAVRPFSGGPRCITPMEKVEIRSLRRLETVHRILRTERQSRSHRRGFLAGIFDAEGHHAQSLRISQVDVSVLERIRLCAKSLGFDFVLEPRSGMASTVRLVGTLAERIRFLAVCRPAIRRKVRAVFDHKLVTREDPIVAIEPGHRAPVVDIQTSTRTFFAAGLATHNCYARPTHEYLGFSAGLDFETKILVKERAPELLRAELAAPRWRPRVVALSGVTDPYQPIERKLGLTRRCLEVLLDFRNPVAIVTKSRLVVRDADLLGELARHDCAAVSISVTTLDAEVHRAMEPRTPRPSLRLAAIEALARAGVPVGVLVAPVVPGLTDHELPRILAAAASAGASHAGFVVLRLPHGNKQLVEEWLERCFPERKEKVLNRLRALHGGRLYDSSHGVRQRGTGVFAEQIEALFDAGARRAGLTPDTRARLSTAGFRRPPAARDQLPLF